MSDFEREFNKILSTTFHYPRQGSNHGVYATYSDENEYVLEICVPGMTREEVSILTEEGILVVTTNSKNKSKLVNNFSQKFPLARDTNVAAVSAKLENGILTIRAPKIKPLRTNVPIQVN